MASRLDWCYGQLRHPKQVLLWPLVYCSCLPKSLYLSASVICHGADKHQWALSLLLRSSQERRQEKGRWLRGNADRSRLRQTHEFSQHTNTNSSLNTCMPTNLKLHTYQKQIKLGLEKRTEFIRHTLCFC